MNKAYWSSLLFLIVLFLLCFLGSLALLTELPFTTLIKLIPYTLYIPNYNMFVIKEIQSIQLLHIYTFILLFFILAILVLKSAGKFRKTPPAVLINKIVHLSIGCLLLFSFLQQISRFHYFKQEFSVFAGRTTAEKNLFWFGSGYEFAMRCQNKLPGRHQGMLLSDQNLNNDPYSQWQRVLSYYLYPTISLRFSNQTVNDTLILFFKNNPLESIPPSYHYLTSSDDKNYVLAVKEKME